jgi:serine phosphatase RsbU (regulator of sigma subunit)
MALARMGGLALANLKRVEMERRSAQLEADLKAAALAQEWILPRRQGQVGPFHYSANCRPGRHVGGDFYDIIPLAGDRLAITIGDVSGKGLAASVLMTASQGFLHAAIEESGDPESAVTRLNEFIHARTQSDKFVTLWVGVLDPATRTLRYVDAGHGYAMSGEQPAALQRLPFGEQFPVGVEPGTKYVAQSVALPDHGSTLLLSDGIIEQPASPDSGSLTPFGMSGVERVLNALSGDADLVTALFEAVERHADRPALADDATAVWVWW